MKKILLSIAVVAISISAQSQIQFSVLQDPVNTALKTKQNELNPSVHFALRAGIVSTGEIKIGVNSEFMPEAEFWAFSFDLGRRFFIGQHIEFIPAAEFGFIETYGISFLSYGGNIEFHYFITENFAFSAVGKINSRDDRENPGSSGQNFAKNIFIGITYKL